MEFNEIHEQVILEIRTNLAVVASGSPVGKISAIFEELSAYFQALGICHLLEFADTEQFKENLVRSGHARRYFLKKSQEEGNNNDNRFAISRSEAFLDAVAAGNLGLAEEIANLSTSRWEADWEYEDDFSFYHFLHTIVLTAHNPPESQLEAILEIFQNALEGADSLRLDVCRALFKREDVGFHEAFQRLMEEIHRFQDEKRQVVESYEILFWPRNYVSVEGLALLKIAEMVGMKTSNNYLLCPGIARLSTTNEAFRDLFEEIENIQVF